MSQNLIAAIEIGSQQVSAIIGRKEPDGAINVIAAEQEPSSRFIQRGRVFNADLMTQCLRDIVNRLETRAHKGIDRIYVGMAGMGLRSVQNQVNRNYTEGTKITPEIVDSILGDNLKLSIPGYTILDVLPMEYKLGVQSHTDPVGVTTNKLVGNFLDIIVPSSSKDIMESCFREAKVSILEVLVSPIRLANVVLTDAEKLSGCAFIDMGAETTTVGIFESKLLRYLAVIPLGGANVTRDLMTVLSIEEEEAEDIKRRCGKAYIEPAEGAPVGYDDVRLRDGRSIPYDQVVGIIEARMNEILQNVAHIIKDVAGYSSDRLIGGIVLTGGASNMSAVDKALIEYTHIRKLRFVKNAPLSVRAGKIQNFNIDGTFNTVLAIVEGAQENCCSDERKSRDIFDGPTEEELEIQRQEEERKRQEEERQRQEEEERKRQEEEERKRKNKAKVSRFFGNVKAAIEGIFTEEPNEDED